MRAARAAIDELAARLPERADEYAERLEWAQDHDAWDADRRAALTLHGLGLAGIAHDRTLDSLASHDRWLRRRWAGREVGLGVGRMGACPAT